MKAALEAEKKKAAPPPPPGDDDLNERHRKEKEKGEDRTRENKKIEQAIGFNLGVDAFAKDNADLLPKDVVGILTLAHKETYDGAIAKAGAIKAALLQSFFAIQDNVNALTKSQRETLDDYLKLTKNGKEDKAPEIFSNLFEPALETMRKVKKAEELGRSRNGQANASDGDKAYADRLMKQSRATHLGEKRE